MTAAGELAGVKNPKRDGRVTPHLFRHRFARTGRARSGSIDSQAKTLGHSSAATNMDL